MLLKVFRNYLNIKLKSHSTIRCSRIFSTIGIQSTIYTNNSNRTSRPSNVLVTSVSKEHFQKYLDKIYNEYEAIILIEVPDKKKVERLKELDQIIDLYKQRQEILKNIRDLVVMKHMESDKDMLRLIDDDVGNFENMLLEVDEHLLETLVTVNDDQYNGSLILEVSAGVGGQEAMIFAGEIFNMYCEYTLYKQWQLNIIELENSDIGGVRHASAIITGNDAYSLLRYEAGVHRVQRIPTTEKAGRIHTSTISVSIIKNYSNITIDLKDKDLRIETKRASGAGGQHVNTTDSAVRIVHLPSGLSVDCQAERSQIRNKEMAMIKLKTKLWQQKTDELNATKRSLKKSQVGSNYRNEKIRTYNFNQDRVTDHRFVSGDVGVGTLHNLKGFLQGGQHFDEFILNIRKQQRHLMLKELLKINA